MDRTEQTRVRDGRGFIFKPSFWFYSVLVNDFIWSIFVPIIRLLQLSTACSFLDNRRTNLCGVGVRNPLLVNPVFRFEIVRIINLSGRVNRRVEVFEQAA